MKKNRKMSRRRGIEERKKVKDRNRRKDENEREGENRIAYSGKIYSYCGMKLACWSTKSRILTKRYSVISS